MEKLEYFVAKVISAINMVFERNLHLNGINATQVIAVFM